MSKADQTAGGMVANIKELGRRIKAHNVTVSAAGIAFYGLLALVPTLLALVSVYGLIADPADVETQVEDLSSSLDETTSAFLTETLKGVIGEADENGNGGSGVIGRWLTLIFSIAFALFSASGAVQKLMSTVSVAYEARETRSGWRVRGLAYLFTAAAIVGVSLMIFTIGFVPTILDRVDLGGAAESAITILQLPVLGLLFAGALAVLYRYGPDRDRRTPWRNPGAIVATLLFIFFAIAFSIYSANVGLLPASYGLLGSIAALMIFLQLTALAVIIGAEVNGAIEVRTAAAAAAAAARASTHRAAPGIASGVAAIDHAEEDGQQPVLSFGKALAGLIALFALARGVKD